MEAQYASVYHSESLSTPEKNMTYIRLFFAVVSLAGCAAAQSQNGPQKISASAVWQVSPQFIAALHSACDKSLRSGDSKGGRRADLLKTARARIGVLQSFR